MKNLIDTHSHLDMPQFDADRDEIIKRALDRGISLIINVGIDVEGSEKSIELAQKYDFIYAAVGVHPHNASSINENTIKKLGELLKIDKVVALGEIGLDYFRNHTPHDVQKKGFRAQLNLANELKKPVIIHCRESHNDLLRILKDEDGGKFSGIIHCFSGDIKFAEKCIELGFYISFSGPVTYPNANALRSVIKEIPNNRILIETDSPYLAPQKYRGKRNEPAYLHEIAMEVCRVKGISLNDLLAHMSSNVENLFKIKVINRQTEEKIVKVYKIQNSLYINLTNRCTNDCIFCTRKTAPVVLGYNLCISRKADEPEAEEIIKEIGDPTKFDEVVFCGFGEPTIKLDVLIEVAKFIKSKKGKVRLNTNGHGNIIHKRNIVPDLKGLVDSVSISLNSHNVEGYNEICKPIFTKEVNDDSVYKSVKDFIKSAKEFIPKVTVSLVDIPNEVDLKACKKIEEEFDVNFKRREHNVLG